MDFASFSNSVFPNMAGPPSVGPPGFSSFNANLNQPQAALALGGGGPIAYCKQNATTIAIVLVVLAVLVTLLLVYRARQKIQENSPYAEKIAKIKDEEKRSDAKEWTYLWQLARRDNVKKALKDVVDAHVSGASREALRDEGDHFVSGSGSGSDDDDIPGFTPL